MEHVQWTDLPTAGRTDELAFRADRLLTEAARLLKEAGTLALGAGNAEAAVSLLSRAGELLSDAGEPGPYARVLEPLLAAMVEAGQAGWASELTGRVDELECVGVEAERLVALRVRLAWAAAVAGEPAEGIAQVAAARTVLARGTTRSAASLDAVASCLTAQAPDEVTADTALRLARRALTVADDGRLPEVACQAEEVLGVLARRHDITESTALFQGVLTLARRHRLPFRRLSAQVHLGTDDWLARGETARLEQVWRTAPRLGAAATHCTAGAVIALDHVFRGRPAEAAELIDQCRAEARPLGLGETMRRLAMARSALAAHQGRRQEMEVALAEFHDLGGGRSGLSPLALGLSTTFCALLEEDRELARRTLDQASAQDAIRPAPYPLTGRQGLRRLLDVLAGGPAEFTAGPAGALPWNRQFLLFAEAVVLGRQGRAAQATAIVALAERVAEPYPPARHLGLRLVAEAAYRDGWGRPADWLRRAEEYFHAGGDAAVANACRALLRQIGVPVPQRRQGVTGIPSELRTLGVTVREYEVLPLLVERLGNRAIADRLHISPRTVEKHVANLLMKVGQPNREALIARAGSLLDRQAAPGWSGRT